MLEKRLGAEWLRKKGVGMEELRGGSPSGCQPERGAKNRWSPVCASWRRRERFQQEVQKEQSRIIYCNLLTCDWSRSQSSRSIQIIGIGVPLNQEATDILVDAFISTMGSKKLELNIIKWLKAVPSTWKEIHAADARRGSTVQARKLALIQLFTNSSFSLCSCK